jgi:superfamily I DNA/RNA helicase
MDDFKKWMDISNKLFTGQKLDEEKIDEVAPLVAGAARAVVSGIANSVADHVIDSFGSDEEVKEDKFDLEEKVDDEDEFADINHVGASMDVSDLLSNIQYYQDNGLSLVPQMYDIDKLMTAPVERVKSIYSKVTGDKV